MAFDVGALLGSVYDTAEIRSNASPPITVDLSKVGQGSGGPPPLILRLLAPTVVLSGPAGTRTIAPGGSEATPGIGYLVLGGALLAVVGVGVAIGYALHD